MNSGKQVIGTRRVALVCGVVPKGIRYTFMPRYVACIVA
jgi:hypothetical protein